MESFSSDRICNPCAEGPTGRLDGGALEYWQHQDAATAMQQHINRGIDELNEERSQSIEPRLQPLRAGATTQEAML